MGTPAFAVPVADLGSGLFAIYGILSAVIGREQTGAGQYVDASLFESALGLSIWESAEYWGTGKVPAPIASANRMSAPYQAVRAADRHFVIGAANGTLAQVGLPQWTGGSAVAVAGCSRRYDATVVISIPRFGASTASA